MSAEQVRDVWVRCHWSSSSESNSSEEVGPRPWGPPGQRPVGSVWVCDKQTRVIESLEYPQAGANTALLTWLESPLLLQPLSLLLSLCFPESWKQRA